MSIFNTFPLKITLILFCLLGFFNKSALAVDTNLYEKEQVKTESFVSKVRVVRDISDEVEVFFESNKASGAYTLPKSTKDYSTALKDLVDSSKTKGTPVSVTVDVENKKIISVQKQAAPIEPELDPVKDFDKIFK